MSSPATHPAVQRDLSLQRLRNLTFVSTAAAAGLLGVFSVIAATTVPGHSDGAATATTSTTATDDQSDFSDFWHPAGGDIQRPGQGSVVQAGASVPQVVSGGSR